MSEHGTISRYTNDKCRCPDCGRAKKIYEGKLGSRGSSLTRVSPALRAHVRFLISNGWRTQLLAKKVGVSRAAIQNLAAGRTKRIKKTTREKLLATHTMNAPGGPSGGHTPAWKLELS